MDIQIRSRKNLSEAEKVHENLFETDKIYVPKRSSSNVIEMRAKKKWSISGQSKGRKEWWISQEVSDHKHPLTQTKVEVVKVQAKVNRRIETYLDTP